MKKLETKTRKLIPPHHNYTHTHTHTHTHKRPRQAGQSLGPDWTDRFVLFVFSCPSLLFTPAPSPWRPEHTVQNARTLLSVLCSYTTRPRQLNTGLMFCSLLFLCFSLTFPCPVSVPLRSSVEVLLGGGLQVNLPGPTEVYLLTWSSTSV